MEEIPKQAETFLQRLRNELTELLEKADKLEDFMNSEGFAKISRLQQDLLKVQLPSMLLYANVLKERLKDLDKPLTTATNELNGD